MFCKKEVVFEEKQTQMLVEKELWKVHFQLETYSTSALYHAQDLHFALKDTPDVFTENDTLLFTDYIFNYFALSV